MSIVDQIKNKAKGIPLQDSRAILLEQKLNKLFYSQHKPKEELAFMKQLLKNNRGDRYGLHASAILAAEKDFCYREQVLSLFYKQIQGENIPVGLKRIFEAGNNIHEKWQRLFLRGGLSEVEDLDFSMFNDNYDLSYTPDAVVTFAKDRYVVEVKSVNTFQFKKMHSHPGAYKQIQFYMFLTGIHKGFILCEDKNTQEFKIFIVEYSYDDVIEYEERLENIQLYKKSFESRKKMVKGICSSSTCKRASKCPMKDACFNIGIGRQKIV